MMQHMFLLSASVTDSFKPVIDALTKEITIANIATVLSYALGIGVTFVLFWWGVRKALRMIMSAVRKGKASV